MNNAEINDDEISVKSPESYWALRIRNKVELMGFNAKIKKTSNEWIISIKSRKLMESLITFKNELNTYLWSDAEKKDYIKALITSTGVIKNGFLIIKSSPRVLIMVNQLLKDLRIKNILTPDHVRLNAKKAFKIIGFDTNNKIKKVIAR